MLNTSKADTSGRSLEITIWKKKKKKKKMLK